MSVNYITVLFFGGYESYFLYFSFTVPKKEATEFTREIGAKVDNNTLRTGECFTESTWKRYCSCTLSFCSMDISVINKGTSDVQ